MTVENDDQVGRILALLLQDVCDERTTEAILVWFHIQKHTVEFSGGFFCFVLFFFYSNIMFVFMIEKYWDFHAKIEDIFLR